MVTASPSSAVQTGVYNSTIVLTSNAGIKKIPIIISVGNESVATLTYEVRNNNHVVQADATVRLVGVVAQKDPVIHEAKTNAEGQVTFTNIPAGPYQLIVSKEFHTTLETAVDIPALIDRVPQIVTLTKQLISIGFDAEEESYVFSSSTQSVGYDSVLYKAKQLVESTEPQIQPNLPADEQQFWYRSGLAMNQISFRNPSTTIALNDVQVEIIEGSGKLPVNTFTLKTDMGKSPVRYLGDMAPGQVVDQIWYMDLNRVFVMATVSETATPGIFLLTFDGTKVTQAMVDAYFSANDPVGDGSVKLVTGSYTEGGNTFQVQVQANSDQTYNEPMDRIPVYYGNQAYFFDGTLKATGKRADTGAVVETLVPIRVFYLPPHYEIWGSGRGGGEDESGERSYADAYAENPGLEPTISMEAAFPANNGKLRVIKYSQNFLKEMGYGAPEIPEEATGSADMSFGFASGAGFASQAVGIKMSMTNTSDLAPMKDLKVRLVLTDMGYDSNGQLLPGGSLVYPKVNIIATTSQGSAVSVDGYTVTIPELKINETLKLEAQMKMDEIEDIYSYIAEINPAISELLKEQPTGKIYARFEYQYTEKEDKSDMDTLATEDPLKDLFRQLNSGSREFALKEQPKIYISYNLEQKSGDLFELIATVSNLGEGIAEGVYVNSPVMPETDYKFIVVSGTSSKATSLKDGMVQLGTLYRGQTERVYFTLRRIEATKATIGTKQSLGKLAQMPSMPVKSQISGNMVVTPMKMEAMNTAKAQSNFAAINTELGFLKDNIERIVDKTVSELARSVLDQYDYARTLTGAVGISQVYDMTAGIANLIGWMKSIYELPQKLKDSFSSGSEELQELLKGKTLDWNDYRLFAATEQAYQSYGTQLFNVFTKGVSEFNKYFGNSYNDYKTAASDAWNLYSDAKKSIQVVEEMADYEVAANQAMETLQNAAKQIEAATLTYSSSERDRLTKEGQNYLETAIQQINRANEIKNKNMSFFQKLADSGTQGWIGGETTRAYEAAARAWVNEVELSMQKILKDIAVKLQAIVNVNQLVEAAEGLKTSASAMTSISKEAQQVLDATNKMLNDIGYKPNQSVVEYLSSLGKSYAVVEYAKSWLSSKLQIVDLAALQNISKTTPTLVRNLGNLAQSIRDEASPTVTKVVDMIFASIFPNNTAVAKAKYGEAFRTEFVENAPNLDFKSQTFVVYAITQAIKLSAHQVIDLDAYDKAMKQLAAANIVNSQAQMDAAVNAATRKSNVFRMVDEAQVDIDLIMQMVQGYIDQDAFVTAYYPSSQVLAYVKSLNTQLRAMFTSNGSTLLPNTRIGRYRNLWIYTADGMDLIPEQITLYEVYQLQMAVDQTIADGYDAVYKRHILNQIKDIETRLTVTSAALGMFSAMGPIASTLSGIAGTAAQMISTKDMTKAMDSLDATILTKLAKHIGELAVNTTLMVNKEVSIASSLLGVFNTLEKWRKVDPELPIIVLAHSASDVVLEEDQLEGASQVSITLRNDHSGTIMAAPMVEIYDSYGMVSAVQMQAKSLAPGQSLTWTDTVFVPHNALRDSGGYIAVFTFDASEAETMTIAPIYGPFTTVFNAHNRATLEKMKVDDPSDNTQTVVVSAQPMGGYLDGKDGEVMDSETVTVNKSAGTILRIFAASTADSGVTLTVKDANQNVVSAYGDLINPGDFILIDTSSAGSYTVTVTNTDLVERGYALQVVEHPNYGAVAGVYATGTHIQAVQNTEGDWQATIPVSIYETGLVSGFENVTFALPELVKSDDATVKITLTAGEITFMNAGLQVFEDPITGIKTFGNPTALTQPFDLFAGFGRSVNVVIKPSSTAVSGTYNGNLVLTINPTNDNFNLSYSTEGWIDNNDGTYSKTIPIIFVLDAGIPATPTMAAQLKTGTNNIVVASGTGVPGERVYIQSTAPGSVTPAASDPTRGAVIVDSFGNYSVEMPFEVTPDFLTITNGEVQLYAKAEGSNGAFSANTALVKVVIGAFDTTAPIITLEKPYTGVELSSPVSTIQFKVFDGESIIDEDTISVSIDGGAAVTATYNRYSSLYEVTLATPLTSGTHSLRITAQNEMNLLSTSDYAIILGSSISATVTVTANAVAVEGATVNINGQNLTTGANGIVSVELAAGTYNYSVNKTGYMQVSGTKTISAADFNINVELVASANVSYTFKDAANTALATVALTLTNKTSGTSYTAAVSDSAGTTSLQVPLGTYTYNIVRVGYVTRSSTTDQTDLVVTADTTQNITLQNDTSASFSMVLNIKDQLGVNLGANSGLAVKLIDSNSKEESLTPTQGSVNKFLTTGNYSAVISATGYKPLTVSVPILGANVTQNITLMPNGFSYDFANEKLNIEDTYLVNTTENFDGTYIGIKDPIVPGTVLYIKPTGGAALPIQIPERPAAPSQPSITQTGDQSLALQTIAGAEYSFDGTTWQDSPSFSGLENFKALSFLVRFKATTEVFASGSARVTTTLYPQKIYMRQLVVDGINKQVNFALGNYSGANSLGGTLFVAVYDAAGKMIEMKTMLSNAIDNEQEVQKSIALANAGSGSRYKVFFLDDFTKLKPLSESITYEEASGDQ